MTNDAQELRTRSNTDTMTPIAQPGPLTERERFLFDVTGYLVVPDAITPAEVEALLEAARRAHAPHPPDQWRQLCAVYEQEPAVAELIDHPSVFPKVRALMGDYFILQSSKTISFGRAAE